MPKLKKIIKEEIEAPQKALETKTEKIVLTPLTQEFSIGEMNVLRDKINEIISNQ